MSGRVCHICGTECTEYCPTCVAAFPTRRAAATMTIAERLAEWDELGGPVEIPFGKIHQRIEELVGRPVWTHELADPDSLRAEILSGNRATMAEVLGKIPEGKSVIVLVDDR